MQSSSREIPELRIFEKWSNPCVPNLPKMKLKYVISFSASINVYSFCRFTVYSNLHNFKPFGPFGIILCLTFFMILSILSSFSILSNFLAFGTFWSFPNFFSFSKFLLLLALFARAESLKFFNFFLVKMRFYFPSFSFVTKALLEIRRYILSAIR